MTIGKILFDSHFAGIYYRSERERPLVIKWLHYLSKAGWSFSNMAVMLRLNLFTYRDLRGWLDEPYATPPLILEPEQLRLVLR